MKNEIYAKVAPDLTVYSVTATVPTATDERLTKILRQAGFNSPSTAAPLGLAVSVRAEAKSANGAVFVREAVVQLDPNQSSPWILSWRQGGPKT